MKKRIFEIFTVVLVLATTAVQAEIEPVLEEQGWDEIVFDNKTANQFTALDGSENAIGIVSDNAVSVAFLNVDVDIEKQPILSWQWLSQDPDPDTDTTKKGDDDRTLAIYVAFPWQSEHAGFSEKVQRPFVQLLKGEDTPGRVLTYIWGGGASKGESFPNPYTKGYGQMIIVQGPGSPLDTWHRESVDVAQDFIDAFGFPPANPVYIAVGSDTDDTQTRIRAAIRDLQFNTR